MKYNVLVCREVWGTVSVDADSPAEAMRKVDDGDYESDFVPNVKIGNQCVYRAEVADDGTA